MERIRLSHFQFIPGRGACIKPRGLPHNRRPHLESTEIGRYEMHVLLSIYESVGDGARQAGASR